MAVIVSSTAKQLVMFTLNSGRAVHLAPGERSEPVEEIELADNANVATLVRRGMVRMEPAARAAGGGVGGTAPGTADRHGDRGAQEAGKTAGPKENEKKRN